MARRMTEMVETDCDPARGGANFGWPSRLAVSCLALGCLSWGQLESASELEAAESTARQAVYVAQSETGAQEISDDDLDVDFTPDEAAADSTLKNAISDLDAVLAEELKDAGIPAKFLKVKELTEKYADGQIKRRWRAKIYSNNARINHGDFLEFWPDGTEYGRGRYENGKRVGTWVFKHPNGQIAKELTYVDGLPDGKWFVNWPTGKPIREECYIQGKRAGVWTFFDKKSGLKKQEERYAANKAEGKWRGWHTTDQLSFEADYVGGRMEGKRVRWHANGQKASEEIFVEGKRDGVAISWSPNGEVVSRAEFRKGQRVRNSVETQP